MNVLERKISEVQHLVQDESYGYKEAVEKVKCELDGDKLYDPISGEDINDIENITKDQIEYLLR